MATFDDYYNIIIYHCIYEVGMEFNIDLQLLNNVICDCQRDNYNNAGM